MVQTSFQLDEGTAQSIAELKPVFGSATNTGVIKSALALARIVSRLSDDGSVMVLDKNGEATKVLLVG